MSDQQVQLIFDVIDKLVVPLVGAFVAYALAHWGLKQRAETLLTRQDQVGALARIAVRAAEQQFGGEAGAKKKAWALDWLMTQADRHGWKVTPALMEAFAGAVEAEVRAMHVADALVPQPAVSPPSETQEATPAAIMTPFVPSTGGGSITATTTVSTAAATNDPTARLAATPQGGAQA